MADNNIGDNRELTVRCMHLLGAVLYISLYTTLGLVPHTTVLDLQYSVTPVRSSAMHFNHFMVPEVFLIVRSCVALKKYKCAHHTGPLEQIAYVPKMGEG